MHKYKVEITVKSLNDNNRFFDNALATATMINMSVRDYLNAYELEKNDGDNSVLLSEVHGNTKLVKIVYYIFDYKEQYIDTFKWVVSKYAEYPIELEIEELYEKVNC